MLKLYYIAGYRKDISEKNDLSHFVLGYSQCHAVDLFYRYYDSLGMLNTVRHSLAEEVEVIHPNQFKR